MTRTALYRSLFGIAAGCAALSGVSQPGGFGAAHSRVTLVSERDALVPGETAMLGLLFEIEAGWHIYQASQNDTGLEPMVEWSASVDLGFGSIQWSAGHRFTQPGEILDHGYEGSVLLMVPVEVPSSLALGGDVSIAGSVEWLACDAERCVPGSAEVSVTLPVRGSSVAGEHSGAFEAAREAMGRPLDESGGRVTIAWEGTTMVVRSADAARISFVPGEGSARVRGLFGSGASEGGSLRLAFASGEGPVVGWIRVEGVEGGGASGVWRVRTRLGEAP